MNIQYLAGISIISLVGIASMIYRKIYFLRINGSVNTLDIKDRVDNSFIFDIARILAYKSSFFLEFVLKYFFDNIKPKIDKTTDQMAEITHIISAKMARKLIQLSNFIQGKRVLKNRGTTSLFIKDMSTYADVSKRKKSKI